MSLYTQDECCWIHFRKISTFLLFNIKWKCSHLDMEYWIENNQLNCPYPYCFEGGDIVVQMPRSEVVHRVLKNAESEYFGPLASDEVLVLYPSEINNKIVFLYFKPHLMDIHTWSMLNVVAHRLGVIFGNKLLNEWVIHPK